MQRVLSQILAALLCCGGALAAPGCGGPNQANIELRKENEQLHAKLAAIEQKLAADQGMIQELRDRSGYLPTLPTTRLAQLFTTHDITFGRLTGGAQIDPHKSGDDGLAIYVMPLDQTGEKIKAAGSFDIDAFDLAATKDPFIGHWHFDIDQARERWVSVLLEYDYALICPFGNKLPMHPDVTVKVTFFDGLTQTPFIAQRVVRVRVAPQPTSQKS